MKHSQHGKRSERVSDAIHRELAKLLHSEVKDPRLTGLTITQVELTPDFIPCKNLCLASTRAQRLPDAEKALHKAVGFLRSQLAQLLNTYSVPTLKFVYDLSIERGAHLSSLIEQAIAEDKQHPPE